MELLNTHDDTCCSIKFQEEQDRGPVHYRLSHEGDPIARRLRRKLWCQANYRHMLQ